MNYAQARALYGPEVVDTIARELRREGRNRACITRREHERLVEWKGTGDRRVNGIVKNIVEGQPGRRGRVTRTDEPLQGDVLRVERLLAHADPTSADHALVRVAADKIVAGLPDAAFEEHEAFLRAKLAEARLVSEALDRLASWIRHGTDGGSRRECTPGVAVREPGNHLGGSGELDRGRGRAPFGARCAWGGSSGERSRYAAEVVSSVDKETVHKFVTKTTKDGTIIFTDEAAVYRNIPKRDHHKVNRSVGEYVKGRAHTNGIESFWATLRRGHMGVYHKMSPKHLQRYVNEFAGRQNIRDMDTIDQMRHVARQMQGKRLLYEELRAPHLTDCRTTRSPWTTDR